MVLTSGTIDTMQVMVLFFPENLGSYLSIDETSLSHGELYTVLTNKSAKGKKGTIVAILKGTHSESIIPLLLQLPAKGRNKVKEITGGQKTK